MKRQLDPEPITMVAAIAGVTSACIAAANYWRTHHKPLPHKVRSKLVFSLEKVASEVRYLRADVQALEDIFSRAQFPSGRALRLGNGALITYQDFRRYQQLTDATLGRLRRMHKLALKIQGLAFTLPYTDKAHQANSTGDALDRAARLLGSMDLTVEHAWRELRGVIDDFESMVNQLNNDLGKGAI